MLKIGAIYKLKTNLSFLSTDPFDERSYHFGKETILTFIDNPENADGWIKDGLVFIINDSKMITWPNLINLNKHFEEIIC